MNEQAPSIKAVIDSAEPLFEPIVLKAYDHKQFLAKDIPEPVSLLSPIINTQSLAMLFAKRGVGKTHVGLGIAYAVASGGEFLRWKADKPHRVLYIDGEMSAIAMQQRLANLVKHSSQEPPEGYFTLLTPDMQERGMPDISTVEGQEALKPYTDEAKFIVIDNLSTLVRTGKENEAESWLPIQEWALRMRACGKSVLFIHHAGKSGQQRGSSRREDVLDLVMELRHPEGYSSDQGARFEVHYTKARHLTGVEVASFEARFCDDKWSVNDITDIRLADVSRLYSEGKSVREIQGETGIPKSTVARLIKQQH